MVRLQEHLHRQPTTLVPQPQPIATDTVTQLAPQLLKRITLVLPLPPIATDMAIRQVPADRILITLVLQLPIIMIHMVILLVPPEAILTTSELQELLMRIHEATPGDRHHHQQITLEPQRQTTSVTTQMMISGHGK